MSLQGRCLGRWKNGSGSQEVKNMMYACPASKDCSVIAWVIPDLSKNTSWCSKLKQFGRLRRSAPMVTPELGGLMSRKNTERGWTIIHMGSNNSCFLYAAKKPRFVLTTIEPSGITVVACRVAKVLTPTKQKRFDQDYWLLVQTSSDR